MNRLFSRPTSSEICRTASMKGCDSMSPMVPPISVMTTSGVDGRLNCLDYRSVTTKNNKHAKRMEPNEMTVVYPRKDNGKAYRFVIEYNTESDDVAVMTQGEYNDRYSPNWNGGEVWH